MGTGAAIMKTACILVLGLCAAAHANFVKDGRELVFQANGGLAAGTMDYSPHASGMGYKATIRLQGQGNQINVAVENLEVTQFVGGHVASDWPFDKTTYTPAPQTPQPFSINLNSDGTAKSLTVAGGLDETAKNMYRSWASLLQMNTEKVKNKESFFTSKEKLLHGDCDVKYTVAGGKVTKSVSQMADCDNRKFRLVDNWRGWRCDVNPMSTKREGTEPIYSSTNTVFVGKQKSDGNWVPQVIASSGAVIAQFFESEGVSHYSFTNNTLILSDDKSSSGDISASGETIDIAYVFEAEDEYKWNQNRNLKAREPFFNTGTYFDDDAATLKQAVKKGIQAQKRIMNTYTNDQQSINAAHKYGIQSILPAFYAMNYNNLKSLGEELASSGDKMASNIFNELLGSTGTTAAALLVRDMVMENKFDNDRDAGRALTAIPFHVRRPNVQLVEEFEKLLNFAGNRFVKMATPLTFGHLVRITCERAGVPTSADHTECLNGIGKKYVNQWFQKFKNAGNDEDRVVALSVLQNMRFGGQAELLKPVIYGQGEYKDLSIQVRAQAIWAAGWDALVSGQGTSYFMPLFANQNEDHELRISAVSMVLYSRPKPTDFSTIMTVMYAEKNYEVINFVFASLERMANSINPCEEETGDKAGYFLKFMKQWGKFETDWGFGVSKTYSRQFQKEKYGYGGSYTFYTIGSMKSTTPLSIGMMISNNMFHSYQNNIFGVHLRIEGLAKGLIRKFKTMDANTWELDKLQGIFNDMNIREREDQPVSVQICIQLKGVTVVQRTYDETSIKEGGRLKEFMSDIQGMGNDYSITHQRAFQVGSLLYEQPTDMGLPMAYMNGITTAGAIDADIKRGTKRGEIYRTIEYDANLFTQAVNIMLISYPRTKQTYGIAQDRIYRAHFPRKMTIGITPVKRTINVKISRPTYDNPLLMMMHSQTTVQIRGSSVTGQPKGLSVHCPSCKARTILSKGDEFVKSRTIVDRTNKNVGSYMYGEYFDCEMDISRGNTVKNTLKAFMPYNKNPRTPWTSLVMGLRQVRAFFLFFPKAEKCGAMMRWSQAKNNPVTEYEIMIKGGGESNGERMFFRGRKITAQMMIRAKGEMSNGADDRLYKVQVKFSFTPGYLQNDLKVLFQRQENSQLGMSPYSACLTLSSTYPDFSKEFLSYDENNDMKASGTATLKYGKTSSCKSSEGEIKADFSYSTTQEAREQLKNKWYYKQCMEQKNSAGWSGRDVVPVSEACYAMVWDATTARRYKYNVDFVKQTPRMRSFIDKFQSVIKAGMLPYWDMDPEEMDSNGSDGEPRLIIDATFKNNEKNMDLIVETSQGRNEFEDVPLNLPWTGRLKNLKFTNTIKRLMDARILNPCIVNSATIRTNDNTTYEWNPTSCWTMVSGHCGPKPSYAVFTKKSSGMPLEAKVYIGGHSVHFKPSGPKKVVVNVNGSPKNIGEEKQETVSKDGVEIFNIFRWGSTYNVYSFLKVWVAYDGNFIEVVPAPSVKGQHCGMCGNYNRNHKDEWEGKQGNQLSSAAAMAEDWKWKC